MAGDWIKIRVDLRDDPAVFKIAERLDVDDLTVIGGLFCFWAWADKHSVDGRVDGATSRLVDRVSCLQGFADALSAVGWLVIDDAGAVIPKFERHNGESAKERAQKNARQARWRRKKSDSVDSCVDDSPSTFSSTNASTREEKRREENKKTLSSGDDRERIPYDSVFETYETVLCVYPYNRPRVKVRDDKRKSAIKKIWAKSDKTKTIDWWREYFQAATVNDHWMKGDKHKGGSWDGANFDFLLRDDVFKRIVEGAV